jgi:hypothetical protein
MNSEQDFSIPLRDLQRMPGGLLAVGARVSENHLRFANAVSTEGQQSSGESALGLMGMKITSTCTRESYTVPVMAWNDPAGIRLTAYAGDNKTVKWTAAVKCQLPASWPRGPVSSRWQNDGERIQDWQKLTLAKGSLDTAEEMVYETDAQGRAVEHELLLTGAMDDSPNERIQVQLVIQKAYNPSTKEPIAYFLDRWWALRKIAVVVQAARFVDGHCCFGCNKAVELGAGALRCPCKVEKHVVYCSKECQKKDWKRHKAVCTAKKDARAPLVDIAGLDKVAVLRALWAASQAATFFSELKSPPFHNAGARVAVLDYIDYFQGRVIKMDLRGDAVDPRLYDRDSGKGAAERAVAPLRMHKRPE